jgi:hypothetical protein
MSADEEPKDWDPEKEENPPENLKRKWIEREYFGKDEVAKCEACGKFVPADTLTCLFCGGSIPHDTGLLGKIIRWLKSCFR